MDKRSPQLLRGNTTTTIVTWSHTSTPRATGLYGSQNVLQNAENFINFADCNGWHIIITAFKITFSQIKSYCKVCFGAPKTWGHHFICSITQDYLQHYSRGIILLMYTGHISILY